MVNNVFGSEDVQVLPRIALLAREYVLKKKEVEKGGIYSWLCLALCLIGFSNHTCPGKSCIIRAAFLLAQKWNIWNSWLQPHQLHPHMTALVGGIYSLKQINSSEIQDGINRESEFGCSLTSIQNGGHFKSQRIS